MICEPWRAWRVIWYTAAPACCAGLGVCSCVCVLMCVMATGLFQKFDSRENLRNNTNFQSISVVPSQFDSLKSVLSLKHFPLNRSRYCIHTINNNTSIDRGYKLPGSRHISNWKKDKLVIRSECFVVKVSPRTYYSWMLFFRARWGVLMFFLVLLSCTLVCARVTTGGPNLGRAPNRGWFRVSRATRTLFSDTRQRVMLKAIPSL